jgi:Ca2+-binding RTX toxin-like protein
MARSWLTHWFTNKVRPVRRPVRKTIYHGRFRPKVEALDERVLPAVTATFSPVGGLVRVVGDALDNTVVVSRDAAGTILVNNGAVAIQGGQPTVANTREIMMNGGAGNDNLSLSETNGALPEAAIFGGDGNDVLIGGSGGNFIDGGTGNDTLLGGSGDDTFQWNPGDGSDVVEGQGGRDTMVFVGSDDAEKFDISANGSRVRLTRDVGNVTMDLNGIETIDLNALGGADTITVNDLSATDVSDVNLDLSGSAGTGDGQPDAVIINGTNGDDVGRIAAFDNGARIGAVVGLFPFVNITGAEATNDTLTVNALGGNDTVDASNLPANLIGLTVNGGAGNDTILGSQGNDTFVWNPGDGSDTIDGDGGFDTMVFNGSDDAEKFDISANGSRVRLTRDIGGVAMDLNGVEDIDLNANGGADTIAVNDQSTTDLFQVNLNLTSSAGSGDGQPDAVIVNGTNGDDVVRIAAFDNGTNIVVGGLLPKVSIVGAEGANDTLTVNTLGGNDTVDTSGLPAGLIGLTVNLGDGQGTLGDAGFEAPAVGAGAFGSFQYDPAGTPWAFAGLAGISGDGSGFTAGNPNAPEGAQVAFLQDTGSFSQAVSLAAGTYTLAFAAAQRGNFQASAQTFRVLVDGLAVGTFTPPGAGYSSLTATFTVAAGSHTITFQGLDSAGGDNTAFIDSVRLTQ